MSEWLRTAWKPASFADRSGSGVWQQVDTTIFLVLAVTLLSIIWSLIKFKDWYRDRARMLYLASKLPGPPTVPLLGNALQFACGPDETLNKIIEVVANHESPMRFWLGPKLFIILTEPRDYEVILSSQKAACKDPIYRLMAPFVGQGLVSGSGPQHRSHRKVIMPMLSSKALNEYVQHFDFHSRVCADTLEEKVGSGEFDIQPYMNRCTFDMIFDTILGLPGSSQKDDHKELVYWTENMYELIHLRMMKVWLHPDWLFSLSGLAKKQGKGRKYIHDFIENSIARKKKEHFALERGAMSAEKPRVMLLEQLIDYVVKNDFMNDEELRDETYTIFTAAQDTTAVVSSFALLHLAMNQEIQDKVRQEIKEVVGDENVQIEHFSELKYTELVIKETLRLYPIAPLMLRQLTGDVELETCTLPKGCSIVMAPFMTHRSSKFWDRPSEFIPERFLPENSNDRHPYAYIPFSGGLRGCIGQKFAMMCLKTLIVHVIQKYKLNSTQKLENLQLKTDISVRSRDRYMVSLIRV